MENIESIPIKEGIHMYDMCLDSKIWKSKHNRSTYVDNKLEAQCILSSKSLEELRKDIGK